MVHWSCTFKLPTKKASSFILEVKRLIRQKCGFDWEVHKEVGKRITRVSFYEPPFGYRVDLRTPWKKIREAEEKYYRLIGETKREILKIAEKYDAKVEVFNGFRNGKFVEPKRLIEAEKIEKQAVNMLKPILGKVRSLIADYSDILGIESIIAQAQKQT